MVKLQNYRYPANTSVTRKGIVTFTHGYGDYMGRYAFMAKKIAAEGYDVVGMDHRGFGLSEGRRGIVEKKEVLTDDALFFAEKVNEKYGEAGVPHFCIGHSLGGAINFMALSKAPDTFDAAAFIAPFTGLGGDLQSFMDKMYYPAKLMMSIAPNYRHKMPEPECDPWFDIWYNDPLTEFFYIDAKYMIES